jgi:hypothetical protein
MIERVLLTAARGGDLAISVSHSGPRTRPDLAEPFAVAARSRVASRVTPAELVASGRKVASVVRVFVWLAASVLRWR